MTQQESSHRKKFKWVKWGSIIGTIGSISGIIIAAPYAKDGIHWLDGALSGPSDIASIRQQVADGFNSIQAEVRYGNQNSSSNFTLINWRLSKLEKDAEKKSQADLQSERWSTNRFSFGE